MSCRRAFFSAALIASYDGFCERSPRAVFLAFIFRPSCKSFRTGYRGRWPRDALEQVLRGHGKNGARAGERLSKGAHKIDHAA